MRAFESDDHPLYICTGPIRSGKTTALMNGPAKADRVAGVLTPEVNGIRKLYDLKTRTYFPFQIEDDTNRDEPVITIGRFAFYEAAFARARLILAAALQEQPRLLIIDEIGRLELQHHGFEPAAGEIIRAHQAGDLQGDLLIVVRDTLLNEMVSHYHIQCYQILHSGDLPCLTQPESTSAPPKPKR
jgi:nucleoside-triphosphatase THEP1